MCNPVAIGLAVTAGSMATQAAAQRSAANKQNRYRSALGAAQDTQFDKTVESVKRDIGLQTDALVAQRIQVIDQQKQELQNMTRDARQASASVQAATAESGVMGRSVDLLHQQFEREILDFQSAAERNISNYTAQLNREAQAIYSRGQSIINQGYPSPLPPPAGVNYGLIGMNSIMQGFNAGVSAYQSGFNTPPVGNAGNTTGTILNQSWNNQGLIVGGNP